MAEIVSGLFGINPAMLQQQQQTAASQRAFNYANLSGAEQGQYGAYIGGQLAGQAAQGLLGIQDPMMQKASMAKQLASQFDITTAAGLRQYAQALAQNGAPDLAQLAATEADKREESSLGLQKTKAGIAKSELSAANEEKLRTELAALGPNPTEQQVIGVVQKYGSPDKILQILTQSMDRQDALKLKAAKAGEGEGGVGKPGPVGKAGAYRDINGNILGAAEMKTVRQEFEGAQKLLNTLNQVSESDVKDAQSYVDWTTKAETKGLASKKTLMAQTKIAASQLLEQINQLPPGSASDADMRAAMKSFPGYSDPDALAAWVNRTKGVLQFSINRGQDQFGFKSRVEPTAPLDLTKKKPAGKTTTSDDDLVNKYLKAKTQ